MWPLIFLFTFIFAAASATADLELKREMVFRKCCPRNESLVKYDNNDTIYEDFKCVDSDSLEEMYNISSEPLYVRNSVVIKAGFPDECKVLQMMQINIPETENLPRKNDCYDRLVAVVINGTLKQNIPRAVTITCNQSIAKIEPDNELRIHKIRKCCPNEQSFDIKYHECRAPSSKVPSGKDWLEKIKISNGQIYEIQHGLNCKYDEYAVELHENMYHLSIEGSTLFALSRITEKYGRLLPGQWCMDEDYRDQGLVARVCTRNCETFSAFCLRKCCPPGQHFKPRRCNTLASDCVSNTDESNMFNISNYLDPLKEYDDELLDVMGFGIDIECPAGKFALNNSVDTEKFHLRSDSLLQTQTTLTRNYCLEVFDRRDCPMNDVFVNGVLCFVEAPEIKNFRVSFVIITISCICLALTLFVYCALPELKNLHGRTLICHVSMMLLACSCLARAQNSPVADDRICILLGYGIYFGFVAAFAWLNVMCFDIWWTFGSVRSVKPLRKSSSERRRFIWYSVYAWSITTLLTLTMFLLDRYPVFNILDANIGSGICWFGAVQNAQTDWPHYIFFVIPMGLISCTNFVLWLLTARHCAQVKSEVHRLQAGSVGERAKKRFRIDRAKYILTGKLWVVMGAGWVSELLSTVVSEPQWLWNIVDLFNELQGVFIFLILVIKPKIYFLIKKRLGLEKPDAQNNATSSSGRTSSTFLSRTISSDERTNLRISLPNNKQS